MNLIEQVALATNITLSEDQRLIKPYISMHRVLISKVNSYFGNLNRPFPPLSVLWVWRNWVKAMINFAKKEKIVL